MMASNFPSDEDSSLGAKQSSPLQNRGNPLVPPETGTNGDVSENERASEGLLFTVDKAADDVSVQEYPAETPNIMALPPAAPEPHEHEEPLGLMRALHRFTLYETTTRYYLVGSDIPDRNFRIMKIDRTAPPGNLNIFEDPVSYDREGIRELLTTIEDGNKSTGGLKLKCGAFGLLGFIRFTEAYYMLLITKRSQVAMIGGHYIYQIDNTELVALSTGSSSRFYRDRNPEESRYLSILANLDLNKFFYFSYTYNITRTLQDNMSRERNALNQGIERSPSEWNDMFVWNHHLLQPAFESLENTLDWCVPVTHGYIDQAALDIFGMRVYVTVIARRSRFFAGARYLKRGSNDLGYVANDVETEQIVATGNTTSFHAPGLRPFSNPSYTSYVQHRGSIPLYWTQENTTVTPKPDIELNVIDPFYSAAALHFDNLFQRYGTPVFILNLIKSRERTPRESKLLVEFEKAIMFLNQSLPDDKKLQYKAFDMSRASKTRGQDVIGTLEVIAEEILTNTGFFHNGGEDFDGHQMQNGVARTNCIDCLDRTNAAQFVIGKRALAWQLNALGIIAGRTLEYDTDCVNAYNQMFHDHGNAIAVQYGGSHLAHTMSTYRKINEWKSHSRDVVESFKRYYHNSFLDSQRQEAYNLFLGNYIYTQGQPMLWDLSSDHYLHHSDPRTWSDRERAHYINWWTPSALERRKLPPLSPQARQALSTKASTYEDYWIEYYRPQTLSSLQKVYSYKLFTKRPRANDPHPILSDPSYNPSPFVPRRPGSANALDVEAPEKKRKGVTILEPEADSVSIMSVSALSALVPNSPTLDRSLAVIPEPVLTNAPTRVSRSGTLEPATPMTGVSDKSRVAQWTMKEWHDYLLNPSVSAEEEVEYNDYVNHPLRMPLVITSEATDEGEHPNYAAYLGVGRGGIGFEGGRARGEDLELELGEALLGAQDGVSGDGGDLIDVGEDDIADFEQFLTVRDNPLTVDEEDLGKKRYKRYKQWLRGKSLFKQSKVDPEYNPEYMAQG